MQSLAERLLSLRNESKLSREALCHAISIGVRTDQRYENGEREPTASTIVALADYYKVSTDYLLARTDQR